MAKTRAIRKRIISVRNINKITRTMEKVAQSKGMKLNGRMQNARSFRQGILELLPEALGAAPGSLAAQQELELHPLTAPASTDPLAKSNAVLLICVTSSRGLCGGYNARVIHAANARLKALELEGKKAELAVIGKKGLAYYRFHQRPVLIPIPEIDENLPFAKGEEIASEAIRRYLAREFETVELICTSYKTKMVQEVTLRTLLPFCFPKSVEGIPPALGKDMKPLYLVEPSQGRLLETLVPLSIKVELYCAMLEAMLCEQAQRSIAMRSASDNADSMTKRLTRNYNRARQAQITSEMIEIVSGSEGGRT